MLMLIFDLRIIGLCVINALVHPHYMGTYQGILLHPNLHFCGETYLVLHFLLVFLVLMMKLSIRGETCFLFQLVGLALSLFMN